MDLSLIVSKTSHGLLVLNYNTVSSMNGMEREKLGKSSSTTFGFATKMAIVTITTT